MAAKAVIITAAVIITRLFFACYVYDNYEGYPYLN